MDDKPLLDPMTFLDAGGPAGQPACAGMTIQTRLR